MAVQAILGAFPAALGGMIMLVGSSRFIVRIVEIEYQRLSANLQAAVLL